MLVELIAVGVTFVVAALLTPWVRRIALAKQIVDRPNARSSHTNPTPRGGGIAIVAATTAAVVALWLSDAIDTPITLAMLGGGLAIAAVGFLDDRGSLSVRARILVHIAAAVWAVHLLGDLTPLVPGIAGKVLSVFAIVWALNLFNFMDGIDGIAASEATFVAIGATLIACWGGTSSPALPVACALAGSSLGFLLWNWPPAKLFMGDAGSGYLGYCLAILALGSVRDNSTGAASWLILSGVFVADATITLLRRLLSGQRIYEAHRTHAYQRLARKWQSHRPVTLLTCAINVGWLLPGALFARLRPDWAPWIVVVAFTPLVILILATGAGRTTD